MLRLDGAFTKRILGTFSMSKTQSRILRRSALDGLGVLSAVVQAGSFVRAGESLGLTQSAVSRAVARLEERVGVRLFRRTARAISMTDEGLRYYESIAPHLAAIEEATIAAGGSSAKVRGRLRVNVDAGIGQFVLTPGLEPFLAKHPELSIEIIVNDRMGDLVREGFDVAIRFGVPLPSSLKARLLLRTRILTCASPDYIANHGAPKRPIDIEKHRCIMMRNPVTGSAFAWEFIRGKKVVPVNAAGQVLVNATGSLMAACLAGQGIAQVLELYARELVSSGQLVQVLPDWAEETYPLYAYHHSGHLMSAKVRAFLDFVVSVTRPK
jgi:DNA-binding transcriptional LysR family regulator